MSKTYSVWARVKFVKGWQRLESGLEPQAALDAMLIRQNRIRKSKFSDTVFKCRPDDEPPPDA